MKLNVGSWLLNQEPRLQKFSVGGNFIMKISVLRIRELFSDNLKTPSRSELSKGRIKIKDGGHRHERLSPMTTRSMIKRRV